MRKLKNLFQMWAEIHPDMRSRLPEHGKNIGLNNQLGQNLILGDTAIQYQSRFRIHVKHKEYQDFLQWLPGSENMRLLHSVISYAVSMDMEYDVALHIHRQKLPVLPISGKNSSAMLGWNTALGNSLTDHEMTIVVSNENIH